MLNAVGVLGVKEAPYIMTSKLRVVGRAALVSACLIGGTTAIVHATSSSSSTGSAVVSLKPCQGSIITVDDRAYNGFAQCDAQPPQRLDLIIHADTVDQAQSVCDEIGGHDLTNADVGLYVDPNYAVVLRCESVDY